MTLKTTTDTITARTASAAHGTGAVITTHGTGTHGDGAPGHIPLGAITDGMTRSMSEDGTTRGTTADSMILGITEAGAHGTAGTTTHTTAVGTADGTPTTITDISTDRDTYITTGLADPHLSISRSEARDIRQDPRESLQEAHRSEEARPSREFQAGVREPYRAQPRPAGRQPREQAAQLP